MEERTGRSLDMEYKLEKQKNERRDSYGTIRKNERAEAVQDTVG